MSEISSLQKTVNRERGQQQHSSFSDSLSNRVHFRNYFPDFSYLSLLSAICCQQGHASSKTLRQQYPPVFNLRCWLMQVDLNNGCKMVVGW